MSRPRKRKTNFGKLALKMVKEGLPNDLPVKEFPGGKQMVGTLTGYVRRHGSPRK